MHIRAKSYRHYINNNKQFPEKTIRIYDTDINDKDLGYIRKTFWNAPIIRFDCKQCNLVDLTMSETTAIRRAKKHIIERHYGIETCL